MNIKLASKTHMGNVTLFVRNLERVVTFYKDLVGLDVLDEADTRCILGHDDEPLITLIENENLAVAHAGSAGLYHTAILFSERSALAKSVLNILTKSSQLFEGSGDHLVSQAFYFHDPEGNGVELYFDRPREEWIWENGQVQMATLYIDPENFVKENINGQTGAHLSIGHVHLKVGNILEARKFYVDILGFDITAEMPTALFVSAGGYHHHLGMNVWESSGASKRNESLGLGSFEIILENQDELNNLKHRLQKDDIVFDGDNALTILDPWANKIIVEIEEKH
jgi:catechol 2,3-dioxygenase